MNEEILNIKEKLTELGISNEELLKSLSDNNQISVNSLHSLISDIVDSKNQFVKNFNIEVAKFIDNIPISIIIIQNEKIIFANRFLNSRIEEDCVILPAYEDLIDSIHPDDRELVISSIRAVEKTSLDKEAIKVKFMPEKNKAIWVQLLFSKTSHLDKPATQVVIENINDKIQTGIQKEIISKMMIDAEKKRFETEKMIERSAKIASVGVIASGITHEINQPLNAIKVGSDGLLIWNMQHPGVFPEKIMKVINAISVSAGKIDNIIKHLRSYWLDTSDLELVPVDINKVINNAVILLGQKLSSHDIELSIITEDSQPSIIANAIDTELILNNLIMNSINNLDKLEGKIDKYIRIETITDADFVYLRLSDNGTDITGISEELLFEPYLYNDLRNTSFGIELAIVKLFVARFNAQIAVAANSDNGTTFTVKFKRNVK